MKRFTFPLNQIKILLIVLTFVALSAPMDLYGQKDKDINIVVSCTEYIGNGTLRVHFGYENPGKKTVIINEEGSVVTYNNGQSKKYGVYVFEPGMVQDAFSQDFNIHDRVEWTVTLPNGKVKSTDASINSSHCQDAAASLDIIPGYNPPEGGKQYDSKIGAELTSLYNAYIYDPANFEGATDFIFVLDGSRVFIEVVAEPGQYTEMLTSLSGVGFQLVTGDPSLFRATGWQEIGNLMQLNGFSALRYARPLYPGVSNYTVPSTGLTNSQGDFAMHSDFARLGYDVDGSGVKIGVLSNSFNTKGQAVTDVINGDLPGAGNPNGYLHDVQVLQDLGIAYGIQSDEGRAMLQIVHDIAPGAELAFRTGFLGEQDMADGIREMADSGCTVIVDDLSYITEPFFRDGVISDAIDQVVTEGVTFFSSAGNFGRAAYTGQFTPAPAPPSILGSAHNFGGGDIFQQVLLPEGDYMMVMQWDDGSDPDQATTLTDLDIFLSDDAGFALLGFNRENIGGFPIEVVPFSVRGDSVYSNIVVARAAGPDVPVIFKYMLFRGGSLFTILEHNQGNSTIVGHPNAAGTIAVGAVRYDKNQVYSPGSYTEPIIMSFSSVGGTPVNGIVRNKPDITAPNGNNTTVDLGSGDWVGDPDTYPNFFGTSAASPHAAGVAALIMEAKSKFDPGSAVDPALIRNLMKNTALEMEEPGDDLVSGSGFIQAHRALMSFANPNPYVENLILLTEGVVPGEEITPLQFMVTGDFFTENTEIYFRGEPLDSGVVVQDENTIIVDHAGFLGNPSIQAYTPTISSSGLDGGFSDSSYFSDPVRQIVLISANDTSKKFGEPLPEFTASVMVITTDGDSLTLSEAVSGGIVSAEEATRLSGLSYYVPADALSDAGDYLIRPSLDPVLDMDYPTTELDHAITEKYILQFVNASLSVERLPLIITPQNMEVTYGETLPPAGISFNYEIDDSTAVIEDPGLVLAQVESEHTGALVNEISLVSGVALFNGMPMIRGEVLVNGSIMVRGTALVNGVEVNVEINAGDTVVYVGGEPLTNGEILARGIALVNGLPFVHMTDIVRGTALVNGNELTIDNGYFIALNGVPLPSAVPAVRGVALVNGHARISGYDIIAENGVTTIDGVTVPAEGVSLINGITTMRGTALVNSQSILRGTALVNQLTIAFENGTPTLRGTALVNGIPMSRGTVLVNSLEIEILGGEVSGVYEDGIALDGLVLENGIAFARGVALVNGEALSRGTALVNGLAIVDDESFSNEVFSLEDVNLMASGTALVNGSVSSVRGVALVNGLEGLDAHAFKTATGTIQPDGSIVYENVSIGARGTALVNGQAYSRGTALVNGELLSNGNPVVNSSTVNENSNQGTILVFDATDLDADPAEVTFNPISFITGTTTGTHWIVPGTYISNNFDISYGLGTLTILPAEVSLVADPIQKTYGTLDPELTYMVTPLLGSDQWTGTLSREVGEDVGYYRILQGSVDAGENYHVDYTPDSLSIEQADLTIGITGESKVYDGTTAANTMAFVSGGLLEGDEIEVNSVNGQFGDKNVGAGKTVFADVYISGGADSANYRSNITASDTASITAVALSIGIDAEDKVYDGTYLAIAEAFISEGMIEGDDILVSAENALFADRNAGSGIPVSADVFLSGGIDSGNYYSNTVAYDTATIAKKAISVEPVESFLYIREGDPLPLFAFEYYGWIDGDSGNESYTVFRNSDGQLYDASSGESAGTYTILPTPENNNYSFAVESAILYVNPYGPGTRAIRPVLNCIEELGENFYIANFEYENRNDEAVYIPVGPDNLLTGTGIDWFASDAQPTMFLPGGGSFVVYFDGSELSWVISSLDEDHKVSSAANANSSSTKCNGSFKSASVGTNSSEEPEGPDRLKAHPNPVSDRLFLTMKGIEDYQNIQVNDLTGRYYPVKFERAGSDVMEVDLSDLPRGQYIIRVILEEQTQVVQVIRQ